MEWPELNKRRKHINLSDALVRGAVRALWTRRLPKITLSEVIPDSARVIMVQRKRDSQEYAVNIVCEEWPEVPEGQVSKEIRII